MGKNNDKCKRIPTSVIDKVIDDEVWSSNLVPIISDGSNHTAYISSEISSPIEYNKFVHFLGMLGKDDKVKLYLNSPGGMIDSCMMISNAIKDSKATVVARIEGGAASAATFIAMMCDKVEVGDDAHFMIHNYSHRASGTGNQVREYVEFMDRELKSTFKRVYKGILTKDEIVSVVEQDKEIWIGAEELRDRLNKIGKLA